MQWVAGGWVGCWGLGGTLPVDRGGLLCFLRSSFIWVGGVISSSFPPTHPPTHLPTHPPTYQPLLSLVPSVLPSLG